MTPRDQRFRSADCESGTTDVEFGLLPRDDFEAGATFEVVDDGTDERTELYRELTVRIESAATVLLVGPWCTFRDGQRCRLVGRVEDGRIGGNDADGRPVGKFATVEFVVE